LRILLINPNTTASVTALVARHASAIAGDAATFVPVTGRFGANYISSRVSAAIAAHAALDALAEHVAGCDAVYLACFGDPGLAALREISPVPVVGMAEASCLEACNRGRRFAIVTGGALWGPMLTEFVVAWSGRAARRGSDHCADRRPDRPRSRRSTCPARGSLHGLRNRGRRGCGNPRWRSTCRPRRADSAVGADSGSLLGRGRHACGDRRGIADKSAQPLAACFVQRWP
jgi:hypothetical protein